MYYMIKMSVTRR